MSMPAMIKPPKMEMFFQKCVFCCNLRAGSV
ncbi:Uncharacterised protein [Mycobacteroides abscessus subsp. abscessus]|nr:Uncharacterised protein [Mycobacteroides abscessus subsp. abscessus]